MSENKAFQPGKKYEGENRVAIVTGASRRIGSDIARFLHRNGFNVVVHYNTSKLESTELVKELNSVRPNSACKIQADLSIAVQSTAESLIQESIQAWGRLDALVNNASIFEPTVVGNIDEHHWSKQIQTNLMSPFFLCQAAYSALKASRGTIVNIIDIQSMRPLKNYSVYCISKAGLHTATLSLARDFAPHVRVNGVSPGAILWPESWEEKSKKGRLDTIPLERFGDGNDIALAVHYLIQADYVTGQVINVDGGLTLNI